ncbi:MAG: hypothetical protein ACREEE_15340 [Dongiaceae bacterium]
MRPSRRLAMVPLFPGGQSYATVLRTNRPWLQFVRSWLLLGSTFFFFLAVKYIPLATATSIGFIAPPLVTAQSVPLLGLTGGLAHYLMIRAFSLAPASLLAPFSYLQLVWAVVIGFLWFRDLPDAWTFACAANIALSGLHVLYRERRITTAR